MPGKAKVGKLRTSKSARKRVAKTARGKVMVQKAAHSHRLFPKSARQKNLGGRRKMVKGADAKKMATLLQ